jgi:exonuclease III
MHLSHEPCRTISRRYANGHVATHQRFSSDEQVEALRDQQPDMVALQEVTATTAPRLREGLSQAGYTCIDTFQIEGRVTRGDGASYGELIASRWAMHPLAEPGFAIPWPNCTLSVVVQSDWGEVELHTAHIPPGSSNGRVKIDTLEGIYKRLAFASERHRVLCGDFNTPQAEFASGKVVTWGQDIFDDNQAETWRRWRGVSGEDWDRAERNILTGLAKYDLADCYRAVNGYSENAYSWYWRGRGQRVGRRFDHIFASAKLHATSATYLGALLEQGLSDHAPLEVVFSPEVIATRPDETDR